VQSIFSALQHVEPGTLADPRQFDFAGLTAAIPVADAFMSDAEEQAIATEAPRGGCLAPIALA
jgi:hypothetical protein